MQQEIIKGRLLDPSGNIAEPGFAYEPVKTYHRSDIKAPRWRIKEWDYYYVGNLHYGLSVTISDLGYTSMIGLTFFNFKEKKEYSRSFLGFFPLGKLHLPEDPLEGIIHLMHHDYDITFESFNSTRRLFGHVKNVYGNKDVTFNLTLTDTNKVGMCIATPFTKKKHFYYNYKINNLLASGEVHFGDEKFDFEGAQGVLDWGRGVWTYKNTWYWLSFSGHSDGKVVGANLGYGFGDTSAASENIVYERDLEGNGATITTKLHDVLFEIPKDAKGNDRFLDEWVIKSANGDINLKFKPLLNRHSRSDLIIIKSIQNQVFGYFDGTMKTKQGVLRIDNVLGFAEKVYNAW